MAKLGYQLLGMGLLWGVARPVWADDYYSGGVGAGYGTYTLPGQDYSYVQSSLGFTYLVTKATPQDMASGGLVQGFLWGFTGAFNVGLGNQLIAVGLGMGAGYGIQWLEPANESTGVHEGFGAKLMVEGTPTMVGTFSSDETNWTWSAGGALTVEQVKYNENRNSYTGLFATVRVNPYGEIPGRSILFGINFLNGDD